MKTPDNQKPIYICQTCGMRDDYTDPNGMCQNGGHDDWLSEEDIKQKSVYFKLMLLQTGLSAAEFTQKFFDRNFKQFTIVHPEITLTREFIAEHEHYKEPEKTLPVAPAENMFTKPEDVIFEITHDLYKFYVSEVNAVQKTIDEREKELAILRRAVTKMSNLIKHYENANVPQDAAKADAPAEGQAAEIS